MTQEMKTNTQGVRLCDRCGNHPEVPGLKKCTGCIKELLKTQAELKQK